MLFWKVQISMLFSLRKLTSFEERGYDLTLQIFPLPLSQTHTYTHKHTHTHTQTHTHTLISSETVFVKAKLSLVLLWKVQTFLLHVSLLTSIKKGFWPDFAISLSLSLSLSLYLSLSLTHTHTHTLCPKHTHTHTHTFSFKHICTHTEMQFLKGTNTYLSCHST